MFSHVQTSGGSGHQKAKSRGLGHLLRCWVRPFIQHLWPFSLMEAKNQKELDKPLTFNTNSPDYLGIFISCLPRAFKQQDTSCIYIFLAIYQKFSTTWEVMDLIIEMYGSFRPDCVADQEKKTAILWFLSLWLRKHPQDFCDYPDMATVKRLVDYIRLNAPSTEVAMQTEELLSMLEEQESTLDCGIIRATTPEAPVLDASGMQKTLPLRPASAAGPQGDPKPLENAAVWGPIVPEAEPVQLLNLDQPLPASSYTLNVAADAPTARHSFLAAAVQLGDPEPVSPLPDVDI
uniref:ral guanine nucleotide dissociation stimulator-like n=1 Tax=Myodes glareolus TaxID=447135 RepID=UPI002020B615|nr:ral guanine nucleotide dissociation stimulator-like [Myodes glareolus]